MTTVVPGRGARSSPSSPWLVGLALALVSDGAPHEKAVAEILVEAEGSYRALEGAYGRAVALAAEYPGDPAIQSTLHILAKALRRAPRPAAWPP